MATNAIALREQDWTQAQKDLIKRTIAPEATEDELAMFLHVAKVAGLDPLQRQIWFQKRKQKKKDRNGDPLKDGNGRFIWEERVSIMAGADGLQARALRFPDCEGIRCAAVYEEDEFLVDRRTGEVVKHVSNPFKNGKLLGAWGVVDRKGLKPFFVIAQFGEYFDKSSALWTSKGSVMIEKVARATACRRAYPENFAHIYDPAELEVANEPDAGELTPANEPTAQAAAVEGPAARQLAPAQPAAAAPDPRQPAQPQKTEAERAREFARAGRDRQIFDEAVASGIDRKDFHCWAEKVLDHPYGSNSDWTDDDRQILEDENAARRELAGQPPPAPKAPPRPTPAAQPRRQQQPVDTVTRSIPVKDDTDGSRSTVTTTVPV